ncbi:MAG: DUF3078 domain-containing protein [Saprospiraceae bacterium]|nr:DUF3078 domain-containing protein [Saprospiraceae bacterium]
MKQFIFKFLPAFIFTVFFISTSVCQTSEQNAMQEKERLAKLEATMKAASSKFWTCNAGIGLDLGQLLNINPYVGSGSNRLGIGGALNYKANYKKELLTWNNDILFNLSTQRIGSGTITNGSSEKVPFEKALDLLNLNSNIAYKVNAESAWAYSFDFGFRSQLLNSYIDSASNKIYLKELKVGNYNTTLASKLFSPALITLAPGMKYTKGTKFYAFLSPVAGQILIIADQNIANLGIHGTALKEGSTIEFETTKFSFGALAKAGYTSVYYKKLNANTELSLYSDYLDKPQNIDVVWTNNFGVEVFKGFNIGLKVDLYYDDNKLNSISDSKAIGGVLGLGKRVNIIEQLLLTYTRSF